MLLLRMKQFGLRYLYKHLGQALKEVPFEITNHNRVIAVVTIKPEDIRDNMDVAVDVSKIAKVREPKELN